MKTKRIYTRLAAILLILTMAVGYMASAVNAVDTRSSSCISSYVGGVAKTSSGLVVSFSITGWSTMETIGAALITIDRKDGTTWTPVKTFYSSSTSGMLGSNTYIYNGEVTYSSASSSKTYRARISFYATDGTNADSKLYTTNSA
jgi:hypothetical protein